MFALKKVALGAAVAALVAAPAMAQPTSSASKLSLAPVAKDARVSARSGKKSKQEAGSIVIAVVATAAVVGGVLAATDNNDNSDSK